MLEKEKIAIVSSGGGMKCAWGAGIFYGIFNQKFEDPDIIIASSGSVGAASYFVSKQFEKGKRIWLDFVGKKEVENLARVWEILNIDYIVDVLFKKEVPMDLKKIKNSKIDLYVSAINIDTGKIVFFSNKEEENWLECLRASMALPLAYKIEPKIKIGNSNYCDSFLSSEAKTLIKKAIDLGAKKVLVIDHIARGPYKGIVRELFELWQTRQSLEFQKNYEMAKKEVENYKIPEEVNLFMLRLPEKYLENCLDNHKNVLREEFWDGFNFVENDVKLKEFLNLSKK
jgi:predicted patatin/cPLA2 family phospholipase